MLSEAQKFVHRYKYYNVVCYIHIPRCSQCRSEAQRHATTSPAVGFDEGRV